MASSFSSKSLQRNFTPSITTHCKYPHPFTLKPQFLTLSTLGFPQLCAQRSCVLDIIPRRERTLERESRNRRTHVDSSFPLTSPNSADESAAKIAQKAESCAMAVVKIAGNRGSREIREKGFSGVFSLKSRDKEHRGNSKRRGNGSMVTKEIVKQRTKKSKVSKAAFELRVALDTCSKTGDVLGAIALYESAVRDGFKLGQYHYNVLLYLCSSAALGVIQPAKSGSNKEELSYGHMVNVSHLSGGRNSNSKLLDSLHNDTTDLNPDDFGTEVNKRSRDKNDNGSEIHVSDEVRDYARTRGFEIYERMCLEEVPMSEAALTSVARIAMSMGNGDMAFETVRRMKALGTTPRLRSYGPALFTFCDNGDVEKAFEVERHMIESGVNPEEPELAALLRASVRAHKGERVYYLLHKLRSSVRKVSPLTAEVIEAWFKSSTASRVGKRKWDGKMVEKAMENGGGGWHGLGWLGKGKWGVVRTHVDAGGFCVSCGEKLVTIDLDPTETENFARSVASIASKRERSSSFQKFQKWLDYYGPFEAIIDAANVGLLSQRQFSLIKVNAVVNGIRQQLPSKKWPLIIVHNRRLIGGKMSEPVNMKLIEKWKNADAIYATPTGSNDDWYWLYAAIKCKCLIVSNDEMRDHIFQILGTDFFPKWKERHQVHFSLQDGNFELHMPPPYSIVIQESKEGHWHIPIIEGHELEKERNWLCVTRSNSRTKEGSPVPLEESHPLKIMKTVGSCTKASTQMRPSSPTPNERIRKSLQTNINEYQNPNSIASDIEASEKLSGCIIDFQI